MGAPGCGSEDEQGLRELILLVLFQEQGELWLSPCLGWAEDALCPPMALVGAVLDVLVTLRGCSGKERIAPTNSQSRAPLLTELLALPTTGNLRDN